MQKISKTSKRSQPKITAEMTATNMTINAGFLPILRFSEKLVLPQNLWVKSWLSAINIGP